VVAARALGRRAPGPRKTNIDKKQTEVCLAVFRSPLARMSGVGLILLLEVAAKTRGTLRPRAVLALLKVSKAHVRFPKLYQDKLNKCGGGQLVVA
jgi:hypothetical protein